MAGALQWQRAVWCVNRVKIAAKNQVLAAPHVLHESVALELLGVNCGEVSFTDKGL